MNRILPRLLCLILALAASFPAFAERTDIVVLANGDKVTGEIRSLLRGKLEFATDSMGTVFIEWDDIRAVISDTGHSVELANGQRFFGPLRKTENTEMVSIETEQGLVGVGVLDVVGMYPVEAGFWERLDLMTKLGFSWDKASSVGKYSIGIDAEYREADHLTQASLLAEVTTLENQDDTRRASANFNHMRYRPQKRFVSYFGNVSSNDELGIDLRALVGIGYGRMPLRSNRNLLSLTAGLDVVREIPTEGDAETNIEAVGRIAYDYFRYSDPERRFGTMLTVFPSLTDLGRWRADFNTDFYLEFYEDFFWTFRIFATYDSDPIAESASSSDYGVSSSLAYEF